MKLISLSCSNCGSPLEVSRRKRYVRCPFCSAQLKVEFNDGAVFTTLRQAVRESAERLDQSTKRLTTAHSELNSNVEILRAENALLALDAEWQQTLDELTTSSGGYRNVPARSHAVWQCLFGAVVAPALLIFLNHPAKWLAIPALPLVLWISHLTWQKATRYQQARAEYIRRRRLLIERLNHVRRTHGQIVM